MKEEQIKIINNCKQLLKNAEMYAKDGEVSLYQMMLETLKNYLMEVGKPGDIIRSDNGFKTVHGIVDKPIVLSSTDLPDEENN